MPPESELEKSKLEGPNYRRLGAQTAPSSGKEPELGFKQSRK